MNEIKNKATIAHPQGMSRRTFLSLGLLTTASCVVPVRTLASAGDFLLPEKSLSFYNTHTDEHLEMMYCKQGKYLPEALDEINYILRDHRTGDVKKIDTNLLDLLFALRKKLRCNKPFHIISGYRSPKTNALLRKKSRGVARKSQHLLGKAVDLRVPGYNLRVLRRAAIELGGGGVGYYPGPDFVHLDVGKVRQW